MSFTIFKAAQRRREKAEKQKERQILQNELTQCYTEIDRIIDKFKEYVHKKCPSYEYTAGYTSAVLTMGNKKPFTLFHITQDIDILKSRIDDAKRAITEVEKICENSIKILKEGILKAKENIENLEKFLEKPSMFFVIEDIFDSTELFCFCYEFQVIDDNGKKKAKALITDNETKYCWIKEINFETETIREMTMKEFENNFIKERIELQEFTKEEDIVEYDNYLRRLFNNQ